MLWARKSAIAYGFSLFFSLHETRHHAGGCPGRFGLRGQRASTCHRSEVRVSPQPRGDRCRATAPELGGPAWGGRPWRCAIGVPGPGRERCGPACQGRGGPVGQREGQFRSTGSGRVRGQGTRIRPGVLLESSHMGSGGAGVGRQQAGMVGDGVAEGVGLEGALDWVRGAAGGGRRGERRHEGVAAGGWAELGMGERRARRQPAGRQDAFPQGDPASRGSSGEGGLLPADGRRWFSTVHQRPPIGAGRDVEDAHPGRGHRASPAGGQRAGNPGGQRRRESHTRGCYRASGCGVRGGGTDDRACRHFMADGF